MHTPPVHQAAWRESGARPRTIGIRPAPAFGALASIRKDNLYWFPGRGVLFTSPWVASPSTLRQLGVLLLTASGEPVELGVGNCVLRPEAVAVAPLTRRGLLAIDVGLVSVNVDLRHPRFGAFRGIAEPGLLPLDRRRFSRFDAELLRAYEGDLSFAEAHRLFEDLVETASRQLPRQRPRDPRVEQLHDFLRSNPACSLDDLARRLSLSYTGASHLFSRVIGVPFRSYQHWFKCLKAAEQLASKQLGLQARLTTIAHTAGFSDAAHFSRAWQRGYGLSPTYVRDEKRVRIFS